MNDPTRSKDIAQSTRFAPDVQRRDFLGLAALWSFLIAGVTMCLGMLRLPMPSVFPEKGSKFRLGPPDEFPRGSKLIIHDRNVLVGHDRKGLFAISLVCTHLGCITRHEPDGSFTCPCHGSRFDAQGKVTQGPAPSPLRYLEVSRSPAGILMVDRAKAVAPDTRLTPDGEAV